MQTIWKFELDLSNGDVSQIEMPEGAAAISAGIQGMTSPRSKTWNTSGPTKTVLMKEASTSTEWSCIPAVKVSVTSFRTGWPVP